MRRTIVALASLLALASGCSTESHFTVPSASRRDVRLRPLHGNGLDRDRVASVVSASLDEPATRRLLARLHADLPLSVAAVDGAEVGADLSGVRPASTDPGTVALRVSFRVKEESPADGVSAEIAGGRLIRLEGGDASDARGANGLSTFDLLFSSSLYPVAASLKMMNRIPRETEALKLCIEDALVRRGLDWTCEYELLSGDTVREPEAADRRADLDRRIEDYRRRFAELIGRDVEP